jgi:N utilization substance protein B
MAQTISRRRAARLGAVQALYQAEMSGQDIELVIAEFQALRLADLLEPLELNSPAIEVDRDWFVKITSGAYDAIEQLDPLIEQTLSTGWTFGRLGYLLRAFLRAGAFELLYDKDVPVKVVITEYVELAHAFLGADDTGFLNAVLDRLATEARKASSDPLPPTPAGAGA